MFPEIRERVRRLGQRWTIWVARRLYRVELIYVNDDSAVQHSKELS